MRAKLILMAIGAALSFASASVLASSALDHPQPLPSEEVIQGPISVVVEGAGTDVILIPGLASSRDVWANLAAKLRKNHRLHLVQVAGFAGSPVVGDSEWKVAAPTADAVAEYIRRQRLKAPAIIGHSLGGEVALMLAARHPERVGRLMVVDALPFNTLLFDSSATAETAAPHAVKMRDEMLKATPEQHEAMQHASVARLAKTESARPDLLAASTKSDRNTVANALYEMMTTDLRPELSRIKAPVEVIYAYDELYGVPASHVDAMYSNAYASTPEASFTRIDDSFHFVMIDQAELFASAVVQFLSK